MQFEEPEIDAALRQQLLVSAGFTQAALVKHKDPVHVLDGRKPVRDGNRRPPAISACSGV